MPRKISPERSAIALRRSRASMRPRHRCRGRCLPRDAVSRRSSRRFNEAAASMPRKIALAVMLDSDRLARFNEAAASMPRKTSTQRRHQPHRSSRASMRPRHRCRGRCARDARRRFDAIAGFNEAAALMPRKMRRPRYVDCRATQRFNEAAASMPRKIAMVRDRALQPHPRASMRPRH